MESAHIKDLLAHLRVVVNRNDTISWGRILRLVKNIGQRKSQAIIDWMRSGDPLHAHLHEWPGMTRGDDGLGALSELLKQLSSKDLTPLRAIELGLKYYEPILKERFDDFPRRQKDLEQLLPMADRYRKVRNLLDDLVLDPPTSTAEINTGPREDLLTLSTVHSAKGLEWSMVFIIWVMEGYFPTVKAHASLESIEEERRLMYVAATRAKDRLVLCYPGREDLPAWSGACGGGLSSFIQALPEDVMEYVSPWPLRKKSPIRWPLQKPVFDQVDERQPFSLRAGDRVRHPAFGRGVISKFIDKEKVEVLFRDVGRKLLHLEYTTLEKV